MSLAKDRPIISLESMWKPLALMAMDISILAFVRHKAIEDAAMHNVFADSVYVPLGMSILYFMMIFFGCRWMKTREPFEIKSSMFAYNLYQTLMNFCIVIGFAYQVRATGMRFWGSEVDKSAKGLGLGFVIYAHYHNKYVEFFDTLFMILRKKNNQISFLHVYHHSLLTWSWYAVVRWAPGGDAWFGACYNSFIHVLMYSYYLFATFGIRCPWKKVLTQMQLVQFCFCFTHALYVGYLGSDCYPRALTALQAFVMLNMLVLFGDFYRKSYAKGSKEGTSTEKAVEGAAKPRPARPAGVAPASYYDDLAASGTGAGRKFTSEEVARHNVPGDGWMSVNEGVYDVTEFTGKHPGGDVITLGLGRDCTILVESYHPAGRPDKVLEKYRIGTLQDWQTFYAWNASEFYPEMKRRVVQRLKEAGVSRRGNLWTKASLVMALFAFSYAMMIMTGSILWAAVWGFAASHIGLSIQHDGNHGAFSRRGWANRLAGWGMDVIGASSTSWEYQHVIGHHQYTNLVSDAGFQLPENDPDVLSSYPLMRMHPGTPWRPHHRLQHWFAFPVFSLMTIAKVLQSDFVTYFTNRRGGIDCSSRLVPWTGSAVFWTAKIASFIVQVVVPCYMHGVGLGLALFLTAHLVSGEYLAVCFIVNHISESCNFMNPTSVVEGDTAEMVKQAQKAADAKKKHAPPPANDWALTQVLCCVNWRSGGWLSNHFSGGLNHQLEHHLFPSISHANYPIIAPVVKDVCEEYGLPYKDYPTFTGAVRGMLEQLRMLGEEPAEPKVTSGPAAPGDLLGPGCSR